VDPQPDPTHASVKLEEVRCALKPCGMEALIDVCCKYFFSKWEQKRPSLCIKMMHTALFIKTVSKVFKVLLQPSWPYVCCKYNHNKLNPIGILQIETENYKFVRPHNFEALFLVLMKF
jgi:hypothetical protein